MTSAGQETIGQRLKRLRLERRLSQRELAAPGVSYAYISRIEAGTRQPSVKALRRLAVKLNISPEYLETGSDMRDDDARELRLGDAELALRLDDPEAAERVLEQLLDECLDAGDAVGVARARIALGFASSARDDHGQAIERLEAAIADDPPSPLERPDVYSALGRSYAVAGHPERAVELFERCLDIVTTEAAEDTAAQVRYASLLSYALSDTGDLVRAETVVKDALERAREHTDPYVRVRLYWSLARLSEMEGKSSAALHYVRRAIALLEATEDTLQLGRAHLLCAWIMDSQQDGSGAVKHLKQAERLLGASASPNDIATLRVEQARAAAILGDADAAVGRAREAIELLGDRYAAAQGTAFWALGEGLALRNETDGAVEAYQRAVDLLAQERRWREAVQASQGWARLLRKVGREEQALDVLERASELGLRATPVETTSDR